MSTTAEDTRAELIEALTDPDLPPDLRAYGESCLILGGSSRARCRAVVEESRERRRADVAQAVGSGKISMADATDLLDRVCYDCDSLIDSSPPEGSALFLIRCRKHRKEKT